jgi:hypothetical protein
MASNDVQNNKMERSLEKNCLIKINSASCLNSFFNYFEIHSSTVFIMIINFNRMHISN